MKKISLGGVALVCAFCSLYAQDPRERNYFYEILDPKHEPKPLVEGFAQERITENLNRGLAVAPSGTANPCISAGVCWHRMLPPRLSMYIVRWAERLAA